MIQQAQNLLTALEVNPNEDNLEVAIDVITMYGSYRSAMVQASKIEFKKKEMLLYSLLGDSGPNEDNLLELKAEELIKLAIGMNNAVFDNAKVSGRTFEDELKGTIFKGIAEEDIAILSNVKRHMGLKNLVSNINIGWNGSEQLQAFKNAIIHKDKNILALENPLQNLRIKK